MSEMMSSQTMAASKMRAEPADPVARDSQLSRHEVRALAARAALRLWPYFVNSLGDADLATKAAEPFMALVGAVEQPDVVEIDAAYFEQLADNQAAQLVMNLAQTDLAAGVQPLLSLVATHTALLESDAGVRELAADQDALQRMKAIDGHARAVALVEHALWRADKPGNWSAAAAHAKDRLLGVSNQDTINFIDAAVEGGTTRWRKAWEIVTRPDFSAIEGWMVSDEAVTSSDGDLLNFSSYAAAIAAIITDPRTGTPLTFAINGPWGSGKSSLARLIHANLATPAEGKGKPHIACWFNAWMHDDANDIASAFAAAVAGAADRERNPILRFLRPVPSTLLSDKQRGRRDVWRSLWLVLAALGVVAVWVKSGLPWTWTGEQSLMALVPVLPLLLQVLREATGAAKTVSDFVNDPQKVAQRGSISDVRDQLEDLIESAREPGQRFVIFVDDVERCRPPRAVDLLEVVNQLLSHKDVITIIIADLPHVAAAAEYKYREMLKSAKELGGSMRSRSYGADYLQKMIQLEFSMPAFTPERILKYSEGVGQMRARKRVAGPNPADRFRSVFERTFVARRTVARQAESLRKRIDMHIATGVRDLDALTAIGAEIGASAEQASQIARERLIRNVTETSSPIWQLAQAEALRYVPSFPRHVKRLQNRLRLLLGIAQDCGLLRRDREYIARSLGKWAALWERWPEVAQQVLKTPATVRALETICGKPAAFREAVREFAPHHENDVDLLRFCDSPPALAPVIEAIVYLSPTEADLAT